ncbi:DUF2812 domain-containing protein [Staphylococcus simiae]|uniref:DUF2812 domain-containing protein n=1 Tax=Staphylococcus simiae TaxID=308354 RepID=UPI001A96244A|nr:DUF2812 domain-containing protein [Staphylococcus simiae]MBO1198154.1 DUF2812 domain-containing protein [Staphylococcus simiae]MBO1200302.1 DUF2812 domain-containing protein [Staphylococcus simiae]MBO1202534.1 DUF2812 domain-containing protein [Staphylococcus simiae]MBO1210188.1 DUF2812 domain-containing protein [Staphylococcus simiae]MBO1228678.1 DUF2812 domain-containing protein [Staphylococcus simiae]
MKKVHKLFTVLEFEKEECWLNEMADAGYALVKVRPLTYYFERTDRQYDIRLDYLPRKRQGYIQFLVDMNIHYIGKMFGWGYFAKERGPEEEPFELHSDINSKLSIWQNIVWLMTSVILILLINIIILTTIALFQSATSTLTVSISMIIALSLIVIEIIGLGIILFKALKHRRNLQNKTYFEE